MRNSVRAFSLVGRIGAGDRLEDRMDRRLAAEELVVRLGDWNAERDVLYRSLAAAIERLIGEGQLPPRTVLPAERGLAQRLNVSRGTVMAAYEVLRERALVATVHGSGTVVLRAGSPVSGPREAHLTTELPHDSLLVGHGSPCPDHLDLRSASWMGAEAMQGISTERLDARMNEVAASDRYDGLGSCGLRAAIAAHLTATGLPTRSDEVLITSGAQQAIALTMQLYVAAGDHVLAEEPTYPGAIEAMVAQQARVHRVPVGPAGLELPALRSAVERVRPRLTYVVASVHNPTGFVMLSAARQRLAELLAGWETVLLDDTTLLETQIDGDAPPPLAAYADPDTAQRILTIGSISKSVWEGLRIGWIRASATTIVRLARLKSIADLGTPSLTQAIAEELLQNPMALFEKRRNQLAERRAAMAELLRAHLPSWSWTMPTGGLCFWVDTGRHDSVAFCKTAGRHGVAIIPPEVSSSTSRHSGHLRVPYALPVGALEEAAVRLGAAWRDHVSQHPCPVRQVRMSVAG